eukprot:scaffold37051_cov155-Skeletonema_dohrnii-CCMP3373.AAC.1
MHSSHLEYRANLPAPPPLFPTLKRLRSRNKRCLTSLPFPLFSHRCTYRSPSLQDQGTMVFFLRRRPGKYRILNSAA